VRTKTLTNKKVRRISILNFESFYLAKTFTIALRVLWDGGVARTAVEEARDAKTKLFVYRESFHDYDLSDINVTSMRRGERKGYGPKCISYVTIISAGARMPFCQMI
jgi:hypothetical protein